MIILHGHWTFDIIHLIMSNANAILGPTYIHYMGNAMPKPNTRNMFSGIFPISHYITNRTIDNHRFIVVHCSRWFFCLHKWKSLIFWIVFFSLCNSIKFHFFCVCSVIGKKNISGKKFVYKNTPPTLLTVV